MNRTKVEKLLGKRVTVTLTDGDIITGKLHKTGEEEFKDNPNLYEPEDYQTNRVYSISLFSDKIFERTRY